MPTAERPTGGGTVPDKPLLRALRGEALRPPPVWFMRQAGRYLPEYREVRARVRDFLELCYTPELAVEVTLQPLRRFPLDAAILFSDILVVPHALGNPVHFVENEGPRLEPVRRAEDLRRLSPDRLLERLQPVFETVRRLREELSGEVALIGFSGMPWTLAAYLVEGCGSREFLLARRMARENPALFSRLIELLAEAVTRYLEAQVEAGAEAVQLFDSWAGVLAPGECARWVLDPARRIVARLRARFPEVPVIAFARGIGALHARYAAEVPLQGVSLETSVPMDWARDSVARPCGVALQGNLDPVALLVGGDGLLAEIEALAAAADGIPWIFNLGHGVLPETPPGHLARAVRHLQSLFGCAN